MSETPSGANNERSSHLGMAGHYAAMSEFLLRGYNTALPVVDRGDDLLTLEDDKGEVRRVQVKTRTLAGCRKDPCPGCVICRDHSWVVRPKISRKQLQQEKDTALFYMFMLRPGDRWHFVLIAQNDLRELFDKARSTRPRMKTHEIADDDLVVPIEVSPRDNTARIWGQRVETYPDPWSDWTPTRFATQAVQAPSQRATSDP